MSNSTPQKGQASSPDSSPATGTTEAPNLPSGTVTFLFTDIEGSVQLWEQAPDAMRQALVRHDAIVEDGVNRHEGILVRPRGEGDSRFAVFSLATDAVAAACAIQQALFREPWSLPSPLRVRLALHTGEADLRQGDYYGTAVNRCARLRAIAHGGQTLLSLATSELVRDALPDGVSLRSLGLHRLKDLQRPEQVFQLMHSDLPADFPPLRSLEAFPNNLPYQLTSFIGREKEITEIKQLLTTTRLLTLTGVGGGGKTRLALQVAADLLEKFPNGVWLVELSSLSDPNLVPQAVATALGVREEPNRPLLDTLTYYLRSKHLLLLLDNCEHVIERCAQLADALLKACPQVQLLTTSREVLGIAGEVTRQIPSLSVPEPTPVTPIERLTQYEAVRLFIERAIAVNQSFAVTNANAPAVAQICWRLDGIPLAIELAAARVKMLSAEQITQRLDDRFRLLTGGGRTALPRLQTLRTSIDWSYELLSEKEQVLFRRLSVFAGGWTLEAAETVGAGESIMEYEVLDLLSQLVDKSLVLVDEKDGAVRYRLLETIRQYGRDRLLESREAEVVREKHQDFFLKLVERAESEIEELGSGPDRAVWLERLETEHDNLRLALEWSLREAGSGEAALRLVGALRSFWLERYYWREGRGWLKRALEKIGSASASVRAKALYAAGILDFQLADFVSAQSLFEASLVVSRELGDKKGIARSLGSLGYVALNRGDLAAARALCEEGLAIFRELGNKLYIAQALYALGNIFRNQGDYASARALYEKSLAIRRELEDKQGIAYSLDWLGFLALRQGDPAAGHALFEESLAIFRELGDKEGIARALQTQGSVASVQGDVTTAQAFYEESLAIYRELGNRVMISQLLTSLASVAETKGDYATAHSLYEESLAILRELGDRWMTAYLLFNWGNTALDQGDYARARSLCEESLAISRQIGHKWATAFSLNSLGNVVAAQGDQVLANSLLEESLTLWQELGNKRNIAGPLEGFACLAVAKGQAERAARLFGAAEALRKATHNPLSPHKHRHYERNVAAAQAALSEKAFEVAWVEGGEMTLEQAIAYALSQEEKR